MTVDALSHYWIESDLCCAIHSVNFFNFHHSFVIKNINIIYFLRRTILIKILIYFTLKIIKNKYKNLLF